MGRRHSKHSSTGGKFSTYERQLLKYGTVTERLGKDSLKNFDSCSLCLNDVVIPVICHKGHIFCKECVLSSLIEQKKEIKRKDKEWEQQQGRLKDEELLKTEKQQQDTIKEFEKNVITLEGINSDKNSTTTTTTTTTISTTTSTTNSNSNNNNNNNQIVEKEIKLNSYWIPGLTPDNKEKEKEKPKSYTVCPADGCHLLKSSQLINVHFKNVKISSDSSDIDPKNKYCCPICDKVLSNSSKTRLLKRCGHVFCSCFDQFNNNNNIKKRKNSDNEQTSPSSSSCYVCEKSYSIDDIINMQSSGTGYSGSGSNLEAKKYTPTAII